ncbi:Protein KIBRA [Myotis davidii]|uniref:Protein KIBRA n=1 Tax=Myotis davidii TaxID=225400 RepID=L5LSD7_MYODS|nr:Protein KIBRA [Myotis davidii]
MVSVSWRQRDMGKAEEEGDRPRFGFEVCDAKNSAGQMKVGVEAEGASGPELHALGLLQASVWSHLVLCISGVADAAFQIVLRLTGSREFLLAKPRYTKPLTFADCISDELPLGWEEAYDPQVGDYFIDHNTKTTQIEDPRVQWRREQEHMLKDYLVVAQEALSAQKEIYQVKRQRLELAQQEYQQLHAVWEHKLGSQVSLISGSSSSSKYDPEILKAEIATAKSRHSHAQDLLSVTLGSGNCHHPPEQEREAQRGAVLETGYPAGQGEGQALSHQPAPVHLLFPWSEGWLWMTRRATRLGCRLNGQLQRPRQHWVLSTGIYRTCHHQVRVLERSGIISEHRVCTVPRIPEAGKGPFLCSVEVYEPVVEKSIEHSCVPALSSPPESHMHKNKTSSFLSPTAPENGASSGGLYRGYKHLPR